MDKDATKPADDRRGNDRRQGDQDYPGPDRREGDRRKPDGG